MDFTQLTRRDDPPKVTLDDIPRIAINRSGSNFTCDPPVTNTDKDYLLLVSDLDEVNKLLMFSWKNCFDDWVNKGDTDPATKADNYSVEDGAGSRFSAWRYGDINVIITDDPTLYARSVAATYLCKAFNVKNKQDRIKLFRAVKYGEDYNPELLA